MSIGDDGVSLLDWEHGQPEDRYGVEWAIQNDPPPPGNGHWLYTDGQWRRLTDAEAVVVCRGGQVWVETFNQGQVRHKPVAWRVESPEGSRWYTTDWTRGGVREGEWRW